MRRRVATTLFPFFNRSKEVSVADPKSLGDVYKSHLETTRSGLPAKVDSAHANFAGTFVNASGISCGRGRQRVDSLSILALGFVFMDSGNGEITSTILQTLMEMDDKASEKWGQFIFLCAATSRPVQFPCNIYLADSESPGHSPYDTEQNKCCSDSL
ncbi:hypothetical protein DEU56DRAFT_931848 [Suillus clintonianus]|uniref:uncharacterized protein n=1 Tax=Suillus clintonianus TaxID=1904413 RepID=UPI001B86BE41|nr:uncharacterized protein DEU56DRAFT_931848 [Suillus clintonianus]KAG2116372.1 hypothetical protein DEU56DRAFT_931848 [Suillus clintonianus]